MRGRISLIAFSLLSAGCQTGRANEPASVGSPPAAIQVAVFDGHNDLAIHFLRARPAWSPDSHDLEVRLPGQSDIPRWRAGQVSGALVTVASDRETSDRAHFPRLLASLDWFDALAGRYPAQVVRARSSADLRAAHRSGRIALMPAIEGGYQIDRSLDNLRAAYARGVRSMTIVYDHHDAIGDGAMVLEQSRAVAGPPNGGLSSFGRAVVAEMNRLGMLVDLSHAGEATALQALELSRAPVIFSHSGSRVLADTPRNLSDETLRALAANGGIVMVPLAPYLTTTAHWRWWASGEARFAELQAAHPGDEAAVERGMAEWDAANPQPEVTLAHVADQIDHVARIAGYDHVGIGTDFDGMGSHVIPDLADSTRLPALFAELARRGWSTARLNALGSGNFERILARAEAIAE